MTTIDLPELNVEQNAWLRARKLKPETLALYQAGFYEYAEDRRELWMPSYDNSGLPIFAKVRKKNNDDGSKNFRTEGSVPKGFGLYGWHSPNRKSYVLIVEGEADAWAAHQMLNGYMTVVSVPCGAGDAHTRVLNDLQRLESYERIYVMLDNDEPGRKALSKVLDVLDPYKTYVVYGTDQYKDASDYLKDNAVALFESVVWGAKTITPTCFQTTEERVQRALNFYTNEDSRQGISFGYQGLDAMMGGQRPGEVIAWIGGTGSGKSTVMRSLLNKLYHNGTKALYAPLEDLPEVVDIMLAQALLKKDYIHNGKADPVELGEAIGKISESVEVLLTGDIKDGEQLLKYFEYAVRQKGVRVIILDHLTWLAETSGDATKVLQEFMPKVKQLAIKLKVTIHLVNHLNRDKADKNDTEPTLARLKHSAAPGQVADAVVALYGDRDANELKVKMLKQSRLWGRTEVTETTFSVDPFGLVVEEGWDDDDKFDDFGAAVDKFDNIDYNQEAVIPDVSDAEENDQTAPRPSQKIPDGPPVEEPKTSRRKGRRVSKRVRDGSVQSEPETEQSDDVRAEDDEVRGDDNDEKGAGHNPAERPSGGDEGSPDPAGDEPPIIVPPLPTYNERGRCTSRPPLPGRERLY